ncbi:MAG: hypothetical protein ACP5QT_07515 [Brevinematia bacterium]
MMIYYYFDSKEEILNTIIKKLFGQALKKFEATKMNFINFLDLRDKINDVLDDKKEFLSFVISKVMKGNLKDLSVFQYLKEFYNKVIEIFQKDKKLKIRDINKIYVNLIFFHTIPLLSFFSLKDRIAKELNINEKDIEKLFLERFTLVLNQTLEQFTK